MKMIQIIKKNIQVIKKETLVCFLKTMQSFAKRFNLHVFTISQIRTSNHTEIK